MKPADYPVGEVEVGGRGHRVDWSHFGLKRRPFRPSVDTASYFPTLSQEAAAKSVAAALERRDSFLLLDGAPGIGKSLVARRWLETLSQEIPKIFLPNIHATRPTDLLQAILFDLNQPYLGLNEQELRLAVTAQLLSLAEPTYPCVLVIDEAQHLSPPAIEELRLLGNIEVGGEVAIFVVLVAQPSLGEALARPAYESFSQRLAVRCRIDAFTPDEAAAYIRHQLKFAGGSPVIFASEAIATIARSTGGIARVINQVATLAADLSEQGEADQVELEAAIEALTRLGHEVVYSEETEESELLLSPESEGQSPRNTRGKKNAVPELSNETDAEPSRLSKQKLGRKRPA